MMRTLTPVLVATLRCSRGSRVRLDHRLARTKDDPTSPGGPDHFPLLVCAPQGQGD
jgi:hypothetical protein